jgi:probable HAF family extracellular repeat protein
MTRLSRSAVFLATFFGLFSLVHLARSQSVFIPLGHLPGDGQFKQSLALDISADGLTVVGVADAPQTTFEAFRWTLAEGMVSIGELPGGTSFSQANAVSPDGTIIVGSSVSANAQESFRWSAADGMSALGFLPGSQGRPNSANDASNEGTIVGAAPNAGNLVNAYRWTAADGMTSLGTLGGSTSSAQAITPDGSVIVGGSSSAQGMQAFRWTSAGGMVGLGDLPGGEFDSQARGVSADGSVVVGFSRVEPIPSSIQERAFRWTSSTGMVSLGDIIAGSGASQAYDVAGDGSVVVGRASRNSRFFATRWDPINGMEPIEELLANAGIDMAGWQLQHAEAISDDGDVIVGFGINPMGQTEAWLASGLVPGTAVPESTTATIAGFGVAAAVLYRRRDRSSQRAKSHAGLRHATLC